MSSSSNFLFHMKSFCTTLELNAKQLRQNVESKQNNLDKHNAISSIDHLMHKLEDMSAKVSAAEDKILGPLESRLSNITIEEIALRCKNFYEANEALIDALEQIPQKKDAEMKIMKRAKYQERIANFKAEIDDSVKENFISNMQPTTQYTQSTGNSNDDVESDHILQNNFIERENVNISSEKLTALTTEDINVDNSSGKDVVPRDENASGTPDHSSSAQPIVDPRTPTLENWKLSDATRSLFQKTGPAHPHGFPAVSRIHQQQQQRGANNKTLTAGGGASPVTPGMPETTTATILPSKSTILRSQLNVSFHMEEDDVMTTPKAVLPSRMLVEEVTTPPTPTFGSSPFRTTNMQNHAKMSHNNHIQDHSRQRHVDEQSRGNSRFSEGDSNDEIDISNMLHEYKPKTPLKQQSNKLQANNMNAHLIDDDDEIDLSMQFDVSPPKFAKVLVPSKCVVADGQGGWIPDISPAEYEQAPTFLRMQLSLDSLNSAIDKLNSYIAAQTVRKESKRLESFNNTEIESIVGDTNSKVIVLGLVQLNRLDLTTEHSIKVSRVRRFY